MVPRRRSERLLVTGAAGKTGLAVIARLIQLAPKGLRLRALGRNLGQHALLEEAGANEVVVGDLTDRTALERALEDVDIVFHICPNVHPEEVSIGSCLIDLAQQARVRRFVYHSVLAPRIREMPHHWAKGVVEDLLGSSGLEFTILQPAPYMQNVLVQESNLLERGLYQVPYALSTRVSMVDLDEVAEAAALIVASAEHSGATYELCAPGLLDQTEIAEEIGRNLGRAVRAEAVDCKAWAQEARSQGMPDGQVETLLAMFRYYERAGMAGSHRALEVLLGREPSSFARFAERVF